MGIYDISSATTSELSTTITSLSADVRDTEFTNYTTDWSKWHGYYRTKFPILNAAIDKIAFWTAGKGVIAKESSRQKQIDKITGCGKDTIRDIAINLIRTKRICGEAFAEKIKNNRGEIINLIPRSPGNMETVSNGAGIITRYNQIQWKDNGNGKQEKIILAHWKPEEIFHLMHNRIADESHGISTYEKIEDILLKKLNAEDLMQKIFIRLLYPVRFLEVDTDDDAKMSSLKTKYQDQINKGEIMLVPLGTTKLTTEQIQTIIKDSMEWVYYLQKAMLISEGVPEVILGGITDKDTEGAVKILYMAYSQVVNNEQDFFESQWKSQIGFEIELPEPPSIDPLVLANARKAGSTNAAGGNKVNDVSPEGQNK